MSTWPDIGAHRLLGDGRSAALITPTAEIDWWCAPRFDSPPVFWSLLDRNGAAASFEDVSLADYDDAPAAHTTRTRLRDPGGALFEVWDGLVGGRLLRLVTAVDGELDVAHCVSVGGFEEATPSESSVDRLRGGPGQKFAFAITADGREVVDVDETRHALRHATHGHERSQRRVRATRVHGARVRDAFEVIRLSTYTPTGGVVASVTTSLPEALGADRQFDYRYAWLRDGSLAASVSAQANRLDIAVANIRFLHHLGNRVFEAPLFTVDGGPVPIEREVQGIDGWRSSRPVRVGNAAANQVQYDALGFVVEAVSTFTREGGRLRRPTWALVRAIADRCCEPDDAPTNGIWELRDPLPLVCADIGRWIALDRALRVARRRRPWTPRRRWRAARQRLGDRVLSELRDDGRIPQAYGGDPDWLDASALLLVMFGMLDPHDPRARLLVDAHIARLGDGPHLRRYPLGLDDGFRGDEGTFIPCSWWAVTALAAVGQIAEAEERADALCAVLPRLLPEEFDAATGEGRGNAALVWSHAEMARALRVVDAAQLRRRWGWPGLQVERVYRRVRRVGFAYRRSGQV